MMYNDGGIDDRSYLDEDFGFSMSDAQNLENKETPLLPAGKYQVRVEDIRKKLSKNDRWYLNAQYRVTEGKYAGCVLFDNFYVWADNPSYAKGRYRMLRAAVGADSSTCGSGRDVVDREVVCTVKVKPKYNGEEGEQVNEIGVFFALTKKPTTPPAAPQAPGQNAAPSCFTQASQPQQGGFPTYNQNQQQAPQNQNVQPSEQQPQGSPF